MTLYDFGKEYLFDPMDMDSVSIEEDPQGVADGGNGIWMTTADMAKIGLLYLDHGLWRGEQLVPESWVCLLYTSLPPRDTIPACTPNEIAIWSSGLTV